MTTNKIQQEINNRINYLEKKRNGLYVLEITIQEIRERRETISRELKKLYKAENDLSN